MILPPPIAKKYSCGIYDAIEKYRNFAILKKNLQMKNRLYKALTIMILIALSFCAYAQTDAYFQDETIPELRSSDSEGLDFNDMSLTGGYGFTFDLFDESAGNGFKFDSFTEEHYKGLDFGDFEMNAEDVPLGGGLLILGGLALVRARTRARDKGVKA